MANTDRPRGAVPVRYIGGAPYNGAATPYSVDSSNGTAIGVGDFMIREADGNVAPYTGTGGGDLLGVCISVGPNATLYADPGNLSRRHLPASTAGTVLIADSPDIVFEVQEDAAGTALVAADAGANADVSAAAPNTTTGNSNHEILRASIVTSTAQLRLLRLVPREDNAHGDWAKWEVLINEHVYKATAGV